MKQEITLKDIAGHATEKSVCRMIVSLANNWQQGRLKEVVPADVHIEGERFFVVKEGMENRDASAFMPPEFFRGKGEAETEAAEVWMLGALAFYALMGLDVFEGQGGATQTEQTPIPFVGSQHCQPVLGTLIRRSLSYLPTERPTMKELCEVAQNIVAKPAQVAKRLTNKGGRSYGASLISFWPEEMLPLMLVLVLLMLPLDVSAQQVNQEMQELVKRCKALRSANNKAMVMREFESDTQWTLMDELKIDRTGECTIRDRVDSFAVNNICYRIAKSKGGVTNMGGRFRSGMDPRYHYSLIEIAVKKGATVQYEIKGRLGEQLLAVAAYDVAADFAVRVTKNGQDFVGRNVKKEGVAYVSLKEKIKKGETFILSISNDSGKNMPFVIINYNSRK